jgi:competence protein ComEC
MLLVGDAERPEEDWLLARDSTALRADILKVGHHGSGTSSSDRFLDAVRPRLALVSVGAGNSYHLPTPAIMRALAAHGAEVLRTDHLGGIVVRTDGHRIQVDAAGDRWELSRNSWMPSQASRAR